MPFVLPFAAASIYWDLPVLLIAVSLVYSATRHDRWDRIVREAAGWIVRMVGFLGGLGVVLYLLSTYPHLWLYAAIIGGIGIAVYYAYTWNLFSRWRKPASAAVSSPSAK